MSVEYLKTHPQPCDCPFCGAERKLKAESLFAESMKANETNLKPESSAGFTPTHGSGAVCGICGEPECPAVQDPEETRAAYLACRRALRNLRDAISDFKGHGMPGFTDRALAYIRLQEADEILKRHQNAKVSGGCGKRAHDGSELFDKCVIRTCRGRSIRCRLGLWGVSAPDVSTAEREARHYWIQYFEDGEYQKHLSNKDFSEPPIKTPEL